MVGVSLGPTEIRYPFGVDALIEGVDRWKDGGYLTWESLGSSGGGELGDT